MSSARRCRPRSESLPHGSADRNAKEPHGHDRRTLVAPSRERGSKHRRGRRLMRRHNQSLPHGSADRNSSDSNAAGTRRRSLTGARIETSSIMQAPSQRFGSLPHGSADRNSRERACQQEMAASGWSLPHGSADRNMTRARYRSTSPVAPSRERGSKRVIQRRREDRRPVSLPHGSADRNSSVIPQALAVARCRSLTGARIETPSRWPSNSPRRRRSLTGARIETATRSEARRASRWVAPSRERGSKHPRHSRRSVALPHGSADRNGRAACLSSRSLTGARIETCAFDGAESWRPWRRSLTGARIETSSSARACSRGPTGSLPHGSADRNTAWCRTSAIAARRSLTGARIETTSQHRAVAWRVAPSRERGSKQHESEPAPMVERRSLTGARIETRWRRARRVSTRVAPSRERGSKQQQRSRHLRREGRSLTGARIETFANCRSCTPTRVAPSRERGSKQLCAGRHELDVSSLPHGSADRNASPGVVSPGAQILSLPHGSEDRNASSGLSLTVQAPSLPHGSADPPAASLGPTRGRCLTGARIETRNATPT